MKIIVLALAASSLFALPACGGNADDKAAENVEAAAENKADMLEAQADNASGAQADALEAQADNVEDMGEAAADKADDNDDASIANNAMNQM
jgi:hypothetical protein